MTYAISADNPLQQVYYELSRLGREQVDMRQHIQNLMGIAERGLKLDQDRLTLLEHDNRYLRARVDAIEDNIDKLNQECIKMANDYLLTKNKLMKLGVKL